MAEWFKLIKNNENLLQSEKSKVLSLTEENKKFMKQGRELTDKEIRYIVNVIMIWILREVEL